MSTGSSTRTPRVVFDTNIFVSAILFGGTPRLCLEAARKGEIELVTTRAILAELANVLGGKFKWSGDDTAEVIIGLGQFSSVVKPTKTVEAINEHPADNRILEAAEAGEAEYIVSGDKRHILPLRRWRGIKIFTATESLKKL